MSGAAAKLNYSPATGKNSNRGNTARPPAKEPLIKSRAQRVAGEGRRPDARHEFAALSGHNASPSTQTIIVYWPPVHHRVQIFTV